MNSIEKQFLRTIESSKWEVDRNIYSTKVPLLNGNYLKVKLDVCWGDMDVTMYNSLEEETRSTTLYVSKLWRWRIRRRVGTQENSDREKTLSEIVSILPENSTR